MSVGWSEIEPQHSQPIFPLSFPSNLVAAFEIGNPLGWGPISNLQVVGGPVPPSLSLVLDLATSGWPSGGTLGSLADRKPPEATAIRGPPDHPRADSNTCLGTYTRVLKYMVFCRTENVKNWGAPETVPKSRGRRPPPVGLVSGAPGAAQAPFIDTLRPPNAMRYTPWRRWWRPWCSSCPRRPTFSCW